MFCSCRHLEVADGGRLVAVARPAQRILIVIYIYIYIYNTVCAATWRSLMAAAWSLSLTCWNRASPARPRSSRARVPFASACVCVCAPVCACVCAPVCARVWDASPARPRSSLASVPLASA